MIKWRLTWMTRIVKKINRKVKKAVKNSSWSRSDKNGTPWLSIKSICWIILKLPNSSRYHHQHLIKEPRFRKNRLGRIWRRQIKVQKEKLSQRLRGGSCKCYRGSTNQRSAPSKWKSSFSGSTWRRGKWERRAAMTMTMMAMSLVRLTPKRFKCCR